MSAAAQVEENTGVWITRGVLELVSAAGTRATIEPPNARRGGRTLLLLFSESLSGREIVAAALVLRKPGAEAAAGTGGDDETLAGFSEGSSLGELGGKPRPFRFFPGRAALVRPGVVRGHGCKLAFRVAGLAVATYQSRGRGAVTPAGVDIPEMVFKHGREGGYDADHNQRRDRAIAG